MNSTDKEPSTGQRRTGGIFRRALGERDPNASTQGGPAIGAAAHLDDVDDRTEPTLDDAAFQAATGANTLPPVPRPQADDAMPQAPRRRSLNFLQWTLASVLTLAISGAIGLALLLAPGSTPNSTDSLSLNRWLPAWAMDAMLAIAGKPAVPPEPLPARPAADLAAANLATAPDAAAEAAEAAEAAPTAPAAPAPLAQVPPEKQPEAMPAAHDLAAAGAAPDPSARTDAAPPQAPVATAKSPPPLPATDRTAGSKPVGAAAQTATRTAAAASPEPSAERAIRRAPPGSFFVQHVSLGSRAQAQAWRARHRALSRARVVAVTTRDTGVKYAVVSGPFATRKAAEAFAAHDGVASAPWFRPLASLKAALPAERH